MSRKRKADLIEIQKLKDAGLSVTDIASRIGVSKGSVSKGLKKLGLSGSQDVVLRVASEINTSKLNAMDKLHKIATVIESELDKIRVELEKATTDKGELRELQIKHSAEIRKQLALALEISQALYRIEEIDAFKQIVLEELGKETPELRDRVLKRLKERRNQSSLQMGDNE